MRDLFAVANLVVFMAKRLAAVSLKQLLSIRFDAIIAYLIG